MSQRLVPGGDELSARIVAQRASQGIGTLWTGDYRGAQQLLSALGRRIDRGVKRVPDDTPREAFYRWRQSRAHRARILGLLFVPVSPGGVIALPNAPDAAEALERARGPILEATELPLTEVLGAIGAEQWRRRGVWVPALDASIHAHHGVFAPTRGEYLDLVATAPLPSTRLAWDIGTGTGVLAAILAQRGVARVIAVDSEPRAIACAAENLARLGLDDRVEPRLGSFFPEGTAPLIVCNPPWLPGTAHSSLDRAVYDPGSGMLRGFLAELAAHLDPEGEGWLIISDLAERLGLREPQELRELIAAAGLTVIDRMDARPSHRRAQDEHDHLHAARSAEITSLWRLGRAA
ncbi:class I SAM-dependent methyltransferase [Leucobacter sp. M11]|uniref:class I SAM-dependent methyltransferase n=1 Tax=Leucobacter sp. M11 TaxID=2993565 RepID=UPI002D7EF072|nr:class I SAM-dependent methyltransferase [Leucobacter sp. M11]MEB4613023.1 class I SAM-dependent methyltransferase [Leucobacter sp. M11]